MALGNLSNDALKELIADWLEATAGRPVYMGLDREEAIRRARPLLEEIEAGSVRPADFRLDDELKDVLYGLVHLLKTAARGAVPGPSRAVYEFLLGVEWAPGWFDEKGDLLRQCAEAGGFSSAGERAIDGIEGGRAPVASEPEMHRVFRGSLDSLRADFDLQGLTEGEAAELEQALLRWFLRFCRRPGSTRAQLATLLLAASADFAREYCRFGSAARLLPPVEEPRKDR
ncbi:MAG: hypothetical protein ACRD1B_08740 [Thermoanaerobaculia bacterium]